MAMNVGLCFKLSRVNKILTSRVSLVGFRWDFVELICIINALEVFGHDELEMCGALVKVLLCHLGHIVEHQNLSLLIVGSRHDSREIVHVRQSLDRR